MFWKKTSDILEANDEKRQNGVAQLCQMRYPTPEMST